MLNRVWIQRNFSKFAVLAASASCTAAFAGWSSGGGELYRDQNNPWFVKNTAQVSVCIEIDESNFGLTQQEATIQFQDALSFWTNQFKKIESGNNAVGIVKQEFKIGDCTENTDLKVQLGTLSKKQEEFFGVPQKYVSAAVRASYDTVNLKGKGFIYVSPQDGPLRMQTGRGAVQHPWSINKGNLLSFVLAHELGHVFGYTHSAGQEIYLMDETTPEFAVSSFADFLKDFRASQFIDSFTFSTATNDYCNMHGLSARMRAFYDIPEDAKCLQIETTADAFKVSWSAEYSVHGTQPWEKAGAGVYTGYDSVDPDLLQYLYLPVEQKVFQVDPTIIRMFLPIPSIYLRSGKYISEKNHVERPIAARLHHEDFETSGAFGNSMVLDVLNPSYFEQGSQLSIRRQSGSSAKPSKLGSLLKKRANALRHLAP